MLDLQSRTRYVSIQPSGMIRSIRDLRPHAIEKSFRIRRVSGKSRQYARKKFSFVKKFSFERFFEEKYIVFEKCVLQNVHYRINSKYYELIA